MNFLESTSPTPAVRTSIEDDFTSSPSRYTDLLQQGKFEEFASLLGQMRSRLVGTFDFGGSARGTSMMTMLARSGRPDLITLALLKGADPNQLHDPTDTNGRVPSVTPLWAAMARNDIVTVKILLANGAKCLEVNSMCCGYNENIFLDTAVMEKYTPEEVPDMKAYLLKKCDLERDPDGGLSAGDNWSPLYWAVRHGTVDLIHDLVIQGRGNVLQRSRLGATLFDEACRHRQLGSMSALCELGFQPLAPPPKKAMWWDVGGATSDAVCFPPCKDVRIYTALIDDYGFPMPSYIQAPSVEINLQDLFDLRKLSEIKADAEAFVQEQLRRGVRVGVSNKPCSRTTAVAPATGGEMKEVDSNGEDGNNSEEYAEGNVLFTCSNAAVCKALLAAGATVHSRNSFGGSVLCMAARNGYYDMIPLLLDAGASVKSALWYHEGESSDYLMQASQPLHAAVHPSQRASSDQVTIMVRAMLLAGAEPLNIDCFGRNPFWMALYSKYNMAAVAMLDYIPQGLSYAQLDAGTAVGDECYDGNDVDCPDDPDPQLQVLHVAAAAGCWKVVEYLLSLDECNVNELSRRCEDDMGGHTALHFACQHWVDDMMSFSESPSHEEHTDYHKTVCVLLAAGADAFIQGRNKETALHWLSVDCPDESLSIAFAIASHAGGRVLHELNEAQQTPLAKRESQSVLRRERNELAESMLRSAMARFPLDD